MDNDRQFLNNQMSFLFIIIIILLFSYLWPRECDDGRHVCNVMYRRRHSHTANLAEKDVRCRNSGQREGDARAVGRRGGTGGAVGLRDRVCALFISHPARRRRLRRRRRAR